MNEPESTGDDLTGNTTRIDFLRRKVSDAKKALKYWSELETEEVCLMAGQIYRIKAHE